MKSFFIHTLGCQMNEYDSERLAQIFLDAQWKRVSKPEAASLLLINTCTVRQLAEQKAFSIIGRWVALKRSRPDLLIGMVGCLAQHLAQAVFKRAPEIDFIAGPRALTRVPELVEKARNFKRIFEFEDSGYGKGVELSSSAHALQARVGVMEGCNQFCAYCAVPYARGREMSRPVQDILAEVQQRVLAGAKEIMLLGQNVNHYGFDFKEQFDFADLLRQVAQLPGVARIRFMTSHPKDFSPRLIEAIAQVPKVAEALHLPLQSGSDKIISSMRRGYTFQEYVDLIKRLRQAIPGVSLSTDLIVGFPGETEEDFLATVNAVKQLKFDLAYCFKFSPRKGTLAADLPNPVSQEVLEKRLNVLLEVVKQTSMISQASWVNRRENVLVEEVDSQQPGNVKGRTATNRWVSLPGPLEWLGKEIPVKITAAAAWSLLGEPEL
jgi:tRNA-2-methylthio-N6-dimethylallyladenosine synthase